MAGLVVDLGLAVGIMLALLGVVVLIFHRGKGLQLILVGLALAVLPTSCLALGTADDGGPGPVTDAIDECRDVVLIGLRGSGEKRNADGGYGGVVGPTRDALERAVSKAGLSFSDQPVDYPAVAVTASREWSLVKDIVFLLKNGDSQFLRSVTVGADLVTSKVGLVRTLCGDRSRIVLVGYSQGAMSIHLALGRLDADELSLVDGVTLFADPLRRKAQSNPIPALGQPGGRGVARVLVDRSIVNSVDAQSADADSWCLSGDAVCDSYRVNLRGLGAYSLHTNGYQTHAQEAASRMFDQVSKP